MFKLRWMTWRAISALSLGSGWMYVLGRAVQVDPIKPTLKAPGSKQLKKLQDDTPLSTCAFDFDSRHYTWAKARGVRRSTSRRRTGHTAGAYTRPLFGSMSALCVG
jgi:hypothetical protein